MSVNRPLGSQASEVNQSNNTQRRHSTGDVDNHSNQSQLSGRIRRTQSTPNLPQTNECDRSVVGSRLTVAGQSLSFIAAVTTVLNAIAIVAVSILGIAVAPYLLPIFLGTLGLGALGTILVGIGTYVSSDRTNPTDHAENETRPRVLCPAESYPAYEPSDDKLTAYANQKPGPIPDSHKDYKKYLKFSNICANPKYIPNTEASKRANLTRLVDPASNQPLGFAVTSPGMNNLGAFYQTFFEQDIRVINSIASPKDLRERQANYWQPIRERNADPNLYANKSNDAGNTPIQRLVPEGQDNVRQFANNYNLNDVNKFVMPEGGFTTPDGQKITVESRLIQETSTGSLRHQIFEMILSRDDGEVRRVKLIHTHNWADLTGVNALDVEALRQLRNQLSENHPERILTHCTAGVGRTGQIIAAHLMSDHGFSAEEAIGLLKEQRHVNSPQVKAQIKEVYQYAKKLHLPYSEAHRQRVIQSGTGLTTPEAQRPIQPAPIQPAPIPPFDGGAQGGDDDDDIYGDLEIHRQPHRPGAPIPPIGGGAQGDDDNVYDDLERYRQPHRPATPERPAGPARPQFQPQQTETETGYTAQMRRIRDRISTVQGDNPICQLRQIRYIPYGQQARVRVQELTAQSRHVFIWPNRDDLNTFKFAFFNREENQLNIIVVDLDESVADTRRLLRAVFNSLARP